MDAYDPATVFSSIDHGGRYAYGNQPRIVHWNLARLAEALLPLFADELEPAVEVGNAALQSFPGRYEAHWLAGMRAKLGLAGAADGDATLAADLLELLRAQGIDFTIGHALVVVGGRAAIPARAGRCSACRARSTSGRRGGTSAGPPTPAPPPTSPRRWTGSTRSTSRATTSSRRR